MMDAVKTPNRLLDLEGGVNFRDIGGYRTEDGRAVKWRRLLRCGHMRDLTDGDVKQIQAFLPTQIHDFRCQDERDRIVNRDLATEVYNDYNISLGALGQFWEMIIDGAMTDEVAHNAMVNAYGNCLDDVTPHYTRFFKRLLNNIEHPSGVTLFHCTAGKDRTGMAAALILSALGVNRQVILDDYLLTQEHLNVDALITLIEQHIVDRGISKWERSWLQPYCGVHADNLKVFFEAIEQNYGDMDTYLREGLGISEDGRELLKARLLA